MNGAFTPAYGDASSDRPLVSRRASVANLLTFVYGASIWIPGVGVPVGGGKGLQLGELLSAALALWLLTMRRNTFGKSSVVSLVATFAILVNWFVVFAVNRDVAQSGTIFGYYVAIVFPTLLSGVLIFEDEELTDGFMHGVIAGAVFTSVLCLLQVALPRTVTDLRNNLSFRLPPQGNRSFGLFPEASIAAGTLTFAIGVALSGVLSRSVRERFLEVGPLRGNAWAGALLVLFTAALITTRSTSVLVMVPVICGIASARFFHGNVGKKLAYAMLAAALLASGGAAYFFGVYAARLENSAALYSGSDRLVSIIAAYEKLKDSAFLGAGLGSNNDIGSYAERVAGALNLTISAEIKGVNSFVFGRCLEEGLVMITVFGIVIFRIGRALFSGDRDARNGVMLLLAVNTLLNALWIAGYRGLLIYWLLIPLAMSLRSPERRALSSRFQ